MGGAAEIQIEDLRRRWPDVRTQELPSGAILVTIGSISLLPGWSRAATSIRFPVPTGYPFAAPDCFWADNDLMLESGRMPCNAGNNNIIPETAEPGLEWPSMESQPRHALKLDEHHRRSPKATAMSGLRFAWPAYRRASADLLASAPLESCGVAYSVHDPHTDAWLVDDVESVADSAYEHRDEVSATLRPAFIVEVANRARALGRSVVLVHTHPFEQSHPRFSAVDDLGEVALAGYLRRRAPKGEHLALVLSQAGCRARRIGTAQEVPVWQIGERLVLLSSDKSTESSDVRYDRQVRAMLPSVGPEPNHKDVLQAR
ncbi:hypothetical protein GA0061098_104612 [Bradyrhizobium shewense]|uniref:Uncharacterized protein n=1 Tax=Bradyrhizobium shewense TaxID=1761772 RepID=A0A1C3XTQ9_9BRAD|nr:hypothetical protein [Bradyrhizobium shewense]SCB55595.1 hypothetical protein GA0061098_104612 [Bradyrhizobium shewense]